MSQLNLVYVHSGKSPVPKCMIDSVLISSRIAARSKIYCLVDDEYKEPLYQALKLSLGEKTAQIILVSVEHLPRRHSKTFEKESKSNREFRAGFWYATSNRFMLIADLMKTLNLENCLHVENDVVLYFDPQEKLTEFRNHGRFAVPFDRNRAIPGLVWYRDAEIASEFAEYLAERSEEPDFDVLRKFCDTNPERAKPLPTIPRVYAAARGLDQAAYCLGYEEFGGIFDAAALGQYLGGIDWKNNQQNTRFFENESSDLKAEELCITWGKNLHHRFPVTNFSNDCVRILSLHAHSKDCLGVSPFNTGAPKATDEIITGERLQSMASLTVSSENVTSFHGRANISTPILLEVPSAQFRINDKHLSTEKEPPIEAVEACQRATKIFVYTHLIEYFKKYIAPRLASPFILITHNSDHAVTLNDLDLLNHAFLEVWFAQNVEVNHTKLRALPIGLQNRQWGLHRLDALKAASENYIKTKNIYVNFDPLTHPSRRTIQSALQDIKGITISSPNLEYEKYLYELSMHKFCVCPRGNGIDTHRFWECQYVDTIPIILKNDWTPAYSGLPVLILNDWRDLTQIDLRKAYLTIAATYFDRFSLKLRSYEEEILAREKKR